MKNRMMLLSLCLLMCSMAMILSCQKIEEAINEKKEQAQELTDKAKNDALGIIQQGKDDIKEKKDALTK